MQQLDFSPPAGAAKSADLEMGIVCVSCQKGAQVGFQVWDGEGEIHRVRLLRKSESESLPLHGICPQPSPAFPIVGAHGWAAHADGIAAGEAELQSPAGCSPDAKVLIEPIERRVARVLMQRNHIAFHGINNDVAIWKVALYGQFSRIQGCTSCLAKIQIVGMKGRGKMGNGRTLTTDAGQGYSLHEVALEECKDQQDWNHHHGRGCH